ncbi:MAG: DUF2892 domain-containing protein [Alphaproteobacteria bacterium]|nr:DUF2892 domain-containing protein [Alphaproteobacteria bacterium]
MNDRINLSGLERAVSAGLGWICLYHAFAPTKGTDRAPGRLLFGAAGVELIRRGFSGYCLVTDVAARRARRLRRPRRSLRWLQEPGMPADPIDRDAADSFPASDPPGWVPVAGSRSLADQL